MTKIIISLSSTVPEVDFDTYSQEDAFFEVFDEAIRKGSKHISLVEGAQLAETGTLIYQFNIQGLGSKFLIYQVGAKLMEYVEAGGDENYSIYRPQVTKAKLLTAIRQANIAADEADDDSVSG